VKYAPLYVALVLAVIAVAIPVYLVFVQKVDLNWVAVLIKMWEGFLYGTGFMLALVLWYSTISALPDKKVETPTITAQGEK